MRLGAGALRSRAGGRYPACMGSVDLRAMSVGGHAFRYLTAGPHTGRVASVFRHGLNALFDDEGDPVLISIQTADAPLHPFAVEVRRPPIALEGKEMFADSGCIRFGAGDRVMFGEATPDDLRIATYTPDEANRARTRRPLLERLLDERSAEQGSDPFRSRIDDILAAWRTTSETLLLPDLIGLGAGSTPAGDDVLVGLIVGLTALENVAHEAKAALRGLRLAPREARSLTSLASAQMIGAALEGSSLEPLRDLVERLGSEAASDSDVRHAAHRVASLGATSGRMMLQGLAAALG